MSFPNGDYNVSDLCAAMSENQPTKYIMSISILHLAKVNNDDDYSNETVYVRDTADDILTILSKQRSRLMKDIDIHQSDTCLVFEHEEVDDYNETCMVRIYSSEANISEMFERLSTYTHPNSDDDDTSY